MIWRGCLPLGFHQVGAVAPLVLSDFGMDRRDQLQMWEVLRSIKTFSAALKFTVLLYFYFFAE